MHPLQADLDNGESVKALRRFNRLLSNLPAETWGKGQRQHCIAAREASAGGCSVLWDTLLLHVETCR